MRPPARNPVRNSVRTMTPAMKPFAAIATGAAVTAVATVAARRPAGLASGRRQTGLSLIEVMVTIAISLVLMAGLIELFVANKQGYRIQEGISRLNEDSRYAMTQIQHHMRMASHWGGGRTANFQGTPPTVAGDCAFPAPPGSAAHVRGLQAFERAQLSAGTGCAANRDETVVDSHVLVARFANAAQVADASLQPNRIYVRSRIEHAARIFHNAGGFNLSTAFPAGAGLGAAAAANHAYEQVIYYLRQCTDPGADGDCDTADDGDDDPILRRLRLVNAGMVAEDVAQDVEHFRLLFMLDPTGAGDRIEYLAPSLVASATNYGDDPWQAVRGAYVQLLIRVPEVDLGADDTTTYAFLSGPSYLPCGRDASNNQQDCPLRNYRRRLLTALVHLRNHALGGASATP